MPQLQPVGYLQPSPGLEIAARCQDGGVLGRGSRASLRCQSCEAFVFEAVAALMRQSQPRLTTLQGDLLAPELVKRTCSHRYPVERPTPATRAD